jgi:hypothetical protein
MRSWYIAAVLLAIHLSLTVLLSRDRPVTYVFTPLVDAVPVMGVGGGGGAAAGGGEAWGRGGSTQVLSPVGYYLN